MSLLLNISSSDASNLTSTTQFTYTFNQWHSFRSLKLVNVCIPNVQYNISSPNNTFSIGSTSYTIPPGSYSSSTLPAVLNSLVLGYTFTFSSSTFQTTITGTAAFSISFSQGLAQVLGFLPNTTYTANLSFIVSSPNAVNFSPFDTLFLTILNLPNSNQNSNNFTFTFFINANQTLGQLLFLSSSEKNQTVQLGNSFNVNHLDIKLRNRDGTFVNTLGLPWLFTIELLE